MRLTFPLILGGLLLLGAAVVYFLGTQLRYNQHPDRFVWMHRARALTGDHQWNTVVLGDSQAMSGIRPDLFEGYGSVINLGLPSAQPEAMITAISHLEHRKPELIIVNISPYSLYRTEVYNVFLSYYRHEFIHLSWPSPFSRSYLYGDNPGEVMATLFSGLGLYRANAAIRNLSTDDDLSLMVQPGPFPGIGNAKPSGDPLSREPGLQEKMQDLQEKNRLVERILNSTGGFWTWRDFRMPDESCETSELQPLPATIRFKERPEAIQAWKDFLARASEISHRVVLVSIPFSASWHETVDRILPSDSVSQSIHRILEDDRLKGVEYIETPGGFSDADFYDWNHLDYCGAGRYTRFLLEKLETQKK